jgi:ribosomal protein S18 acetylase RimI-like enzyme
VSWFRSSRRRLKERALDVGRPTEGREREDALVPPGEPEGNGRPEAPAREDLIGRPLADLHELAREHGVPRYRLLRKEELIGALAGEGPAPVRAPERRDVSAPPSLAISEVTSGSVEVLEAVQHLVHELSSTASAPGASDLEEIVSSSVTKLLVARDEHGETVGMLTLAIFRIPTGLRAWIEDVVVAEPARRNGVGEALTREAVRIASDAGARTVDLTSRPERKAANRMYDKLGFVRRQTNEYRLEP